MHRLVLAFRAFFALLFRANCLTTWSPNWAWRQTCARSRCAARARRPEIKPADGALQLLGMLQREARILDFFMEDIGSLYR